MARLVSLSTTAILFGAIGFGLGVYAEPSEQAEQFRAFVRRGIDLIDAGVGAHESKNETTKSAEEERTEIQTAPPPAETAAPALVPPETIDHSATEHGFALPATPQSDSAEGIPNSSSAYGTPAPADPAPSRAAVPVKKPQSPPKSN